MIDKLINVIRNSALEDAASLVERKAGNYMYAKAWRVAAKEIRAMKEKLTPDDTKLTDNEEQISSTSSRPVGA